MEKHDTGQILLRISLSLVFLWFSISQLRNPEAWTGFVPEFLTTMIAAKNLVLMNGMFELVFGLLLLLGLYVRVAATLLGLHLLGIAFSLGWSALGIRDFGLAMATLSIALLGPDSWSLDHRFNRN